MASARLRARPHNSAAVMETFWRRFTGGREPDHLRADDCDLLEIERRAGTARLQLT